MPRIPATGAVAGVQGSSEMGVGGGLTSFSLLPEALPYPMGKDRVWFQGAVRQGFKGLRIEGEQSQPVGPEKEGIFFLSWLIMYNSC